MKRTSFSLNTLLVIGAVSLGFSACKKVDTPDKLGDRGSTIVKILNGSTTTPAIIAMNPTPVVQTIKIADFRRDANNNASLNTTQVIVFENSQTLLDEVNDAKGTEFEFLPVDAYTFTTESGVTVAGNTHTITLAPNEIAREIRIVLDKDKLDFSKSYAFGFVITNAGSSKISADYGEAVINPIVKNKYDAVYTLKGYHNRVPYNFPYETQIEFRTAGANSNVFYWNEVDGNAHPIGVGPDNDMSWYGYAIAPVVVFDPATDLISDVFNSGDPLTPMAVFTGAGSNVSRYDAASRTVYVYWNYNNNPDRAFFDTLTYLRAR